MSWRRGLPKPVFITIFMALVFVGGLFVVEAVKAFIKKYGSGQQAMR